jgi:hypothetical protein
LGNYFILYFYFIEDAQEEAQDLYQKARKMKRGSKVVQQFLQKIISEIAAL